MNILIVGAGGFIGKNLTINLSKNKNNNITLIDLNSNNFKNIENKINNCKLIECEINNNTNFDELVLNQDLVFYLVSTIIPSTSNKNVPKEIESNVLTITYFLESCVRNNVKKVVFISSGGTVYGKTTKLPITEEAPTNPICSYGIQKLMTEKLLYLYNYLYGLDYRIIRLANPYGPYQIPNGILGAVTTFTYKALKNEEIVIYGDGSVIRDFIYIDDAIKAILNITNGNSEYKIFNVGSGKGTSINCILDTIEKTLHKKLNVRYENRRKNDVPINYLDVSRYEKEYGIINLTSLEEGIKKTSDFLKEN